MTLSQLQRGHDWPACPSPNQECTCGFSQAFWADVLSRKMEPELSVAGPKITAVNVLLPGCDARTDDGRPHGTQPCFRQDALAEQKASHPMPDSGKVNRVRNGARFVRAEGRKVSNALAVSKTQAECGPM